MSKGDVTTRELVLEMLSMLRERGEEPKLLLVHPDEVAELPNEDEMGGPMELQIDARCPLGAICSLSYRLETDEEFTQIRRVLDQRNTIHEMQHELAEFNTRSRLTHRVRRYLN